ncbi:MAG: ParB family transcriptional regulator, chromosome partitioning protein [Thermomicrobiales bacterium]|nr:ParB family transcriptional regulator, chromosome partitioning protein [Thermomicrobiales bacterium]
MASATAEAAGGRKRRFTVDALFADHRPQAVGVEDLPTAKEIRLDRIEADPDQPRRTFDAARLAELAASIGIEGVLQPIVVRYDEARDVYVIVHGERRWRASRQAGLTTIPALVRDVPEERRLIQQLMENVVREDLNAVDRAAALRSLKSQLGDAPWEQVAEAVGIRRSRLFQLLGTEKLPEAIQDDIRAGRLSEKQSRALQGLPEGHQIALRDAILADDLPADEAMRLARALRAVRIPDDPATAMVALAEIRAEATKPTQSDAPDEDESAALLSAVAAAAGGSRTERAALARTADGFGLAPYDGERLRAEVLALARSLARAPAADLRPGTPVHASLLALYGALDAALAE